MNKYRPEIDGLRAIAVIMVIFYHADMPFFGKHGFRGGYIGVDIFFVISGYLICANITRELMAGKFSLASFYERRMRRILPAAICVMAVTVTFAWKLLFPGKFKEFAGSLVAATLSLSNFFFWQQESYIGAPSAFKPLLHTWTLGVEEQYYLIFPTLLMLMVKKSQRFIVGWFFALFAVSLGLAQWGSHAFSDASFYLLPTRLWEFFGGALLARAELSFDRTSNNPKLSSFMSILGLLMIFSCLSFFNATTAHPSIVTSVPVFGAMAIIWYAGGCDTVTRFLSSRVMVGVGLLSYSLYLWHQPVLVFARHMIPGEMSTFEKSILIAGIFILSYLSWRFIEKPFRNPKKIEGKVFWPALGLSAGLLIVVGACGYITGGLPQRLSDFARTIYEDLQSVEHGKLKNAKGVCLYSAASEPCVFGTGSWVLLGDSFAGVYGPALLSKLTDRGEGLMLLVHPECPFVSDVWFGFTPDCPSVNRERWKIIKGFQEKKTIVVAANAKLFSRGKIPEKSSEVSEESIVANYQSNILELLKLGHRVILIYQPPDPGMDVISNLSYSLLRDSDIRELQPVYSLAPAPFDTAKSFDRIYQPLGSSENLVHIHPAEILCPSESGKRHCIVIEKSGSNYNEGEHLSGHGAEQIIDEIFKKLE